MNAEILNAAEWLENQMKHTPYGTITLTVKTHDGRPTIIEKTVSEKSQITGCTGENKSETRKH